MIYSFDPFELDEERFQLRRCGVPIAVQPKVLALLIYLVKRRDRVVDKEELFASIWSDVRVAPSALAQSARQARRALGDDAGRPRILETVRTRGYRFIADVVETSRASRSAPAPNVRAFLVVVDSSSGASELRVMRVVAVEPAPAIDDRRYG